MVDTGRLGVKIEAQCKEAAEDAIKSAREELGMRRGEFRRAMRRRDGATEAAVYWHAYKAGIDIDPDRLREILEIILEFIKALLTLFNL